MNTLAERAARHPFFDGMAAENIAIATQGAVEVKFAPCDMILREGEPADRFYLIETGGVALEAHEPADGTFPIQTLAAGDVLGWSWLLSPFVWHFQARAMEPTTTLSLDAAHLLVSAEENHDFGYELLKRTGHILMARLHAVRARLINSQLELANCRRAAAGPSSLVRTRKASTVAPT
jgi:CRP/FNR family cyclic AMP-dependent transcriptional regulator